MLSIVLAYYCESRTATRARLYTNLCVIIVNLLCAMHHSYPLVYSLSNEVSRDGSR